MFGLYVDGQIRVGSSQERPEHGFQWSRPCLTRRVGACWEPPQGAVNAANPASVTDPGPHSAALADRFPAASSPPSTDVGDLPQFWASFNKAPKRNQNGGWARPGTQDR